MRSALLLAAAASMAAAPSFAQSLADRIAAVHDGVVRISFASRPNVCSDGQGSTWTRPTSLDASGDGYRACVRGPVVVTLGRTDGQTISVRTRIGGRSGSAGSNVDLGEVAPNDAARYLASLARTLGGRSGDEALTGAVLADGVDLSPVLRDIIVDDHAPIASRKQALFWFGQSDVPTRDLIALYAHLTPYQLREHFTFVVSQRRDDESLAKLMDIARHDRDAQIRKQAMFWLGQSNDRRVVKFFRDLLAP
jgi:hypothetical protein